jgi:predicted DCC family thiol-disulfide oxidoreductase YuxK
MAEARATFIFDGDCGICRTWVDYWRLLTGDRVVYRPYQEAARDYSAIPAGDFRKAVQLVAADGEILAGGAATFKLLSYAPGRGIWWWLYRHVPGFEPASELAYRVLSRRRGLLAWLTHALWGRKLEPERYALVAWVFLRGLGLVYLAAFISLAVQIRGLVGAQGILPLGEYLAAARQGWGADAYWRLPTLFWLDASDAALVAGAWLGVALAVLLTLGFLQRVALVGLFALYLSFVYAGQIFMTYQWDMLLVEAGFLAIFLTGGSRIAVWLYRLLLFRFLFLAGLVKVASGDPTWQQLTALDYHFFTQPLPSPLAYYAAQLPHWLLAAGTAAALVIELVAVALIFLPRRPRMLAAALVTLFQILIMLTGSYNWFNLLTILLCLFLLDDQALRRCVGTNFAAAIVVLAPRPGRIATAIAAIVALVVVPVGLNLVYSSLTGRNIPVAGAMTEALAPLLIVNPYGLFATTTTTRPVIAFEGSDDNRTWREYVLPFLPGPIERAPTWNIPYQPRLDWQLWFAAYGSAAQHRWIEHLLQRLLEGAPHVLGLFAENPYPQGAPKYVRALLYDYRFAAQGGAWWERQPIGTYYPAVSLPDFQLGPGSAEAGAKVPR